MADKKLYKTANGKEIDMQTLILQNETVRAVGNMNTNARGDVIDNKNDVTSSRSEQVNKAYRKQIGNIAKDEPVVSSQKAAALAAKEAIVGLDEEVQAEVKKPKARKKAKPKAKQTEEPKTGLAAAIAKTQENK